MFDHSDPDPTHSQAQESPRHKRSRQLHEVRVPQYARACAVDRSGQRGQHSHLNAVIFLIIFRRLTIRVTNPVHLLEEISCKKNKIKNKPKIQQEGSTLLFNFF